MRKSRSTTCIAREILTEAERISYKLLPLLNYATVYGVSFHKFVMWRRGVLKSPFARDPQKISLNADRHSRGRSAVAAGG